MSLWNKKLNKNRLIIALIISKILLPMRGIADNRPCCDVSRDMSQAMAGRTTENPNMSRFIDRMSRQQAISMPALYLPKPKEGKNIHVLRIFRRSKILKIASILLSIYLRGENYRTCLPALGEAKGSGRLLDTD